MQSELRRTNGAIFKRGENNPWPGQYIVHGASEEKPTDGADQERLPAKRAAANAAKRPIMVSENPVPADRQNKQPQRQECNRFNLGEAPGQPQATQRPWRRRFTRGAASVQINRPSTGASPPPDAFGRTETIGDLEANGRSPPETTGNREKSVTTPVTTRGSSFLDSERKSLIMWRTQKELNLQPSDP
jgi:hypothetical protein